MRTLQVNSGALTEFAGRCGELAGSLAASPAPAAAGSSALASAAAVRAAHADVAGLVSASSARMRGTGLRLSAAGAAFDRQQQESAQMLGTLGQVSR